MPFKQSLPSGPSEIAQALQDLARQRPALAQVLSAFGPLLGAQAALEASLPTLASPLPQLQDQALAQGQPLAGVADFLEVEGLDLDAYLLQAAQALLPAMAQGLPGLSDPAARLAEALKLGRLPARETFGALLSGQGGELARLAQSLGMEPGALEYCLGQLIKPLLARRAQALAPLMQGHAWEQGTCPICGSLPEMAILRGEGGQRWLRCSQCAHQWRFDRTTCPVCGNQDQDLLRFMYAEDQPRQRADLCQACGKYIVTLDIRESDGEPVWAVAALGLLHLDILAQGQGLVPAARTAFNRLD